MNMNNERIFRRTVEARKIAQFAINEFRLTDVLSRSMICAILPKLCKAAIKYQNPGLTAWGFCVLGREKCVDWTAIGIAISLIVGAFGLVWAEIKTLRERAHTMDSIAQRLITQTEMIDERQGEIISALNHVRENHHKLLDLVHAQSTAIAVLTESIKNQHV